MQFEDTLMIWRFDSLGHNFAQETHVNNKLFSATFYNKDSTINEEQEYLWNDSIDDLHWSIQYLDGATFEGLIGNNKYWGDWTMKLSNDTSVVVHYGYPAPSERFPDTLDVWTNGTLVGYEIRNEEGIHVFQKL